MKPERCFQCKQIIIDNKCSCGIWWDKNEIPGYAKVMKKGLEAFDYYCEQMNKESVLSMEDFENCVVYFKGSSKMLERVKHFVITQKRLEESEDD